jgi:hypothetical protein
VSQERNNFIRRTRCIAAQVFLLFLLLNLVARTSLLAQSFASGVAFGIVQPAEISEASGLAASRQNPGVLWTHNDSSYAGSVFAIATNGPLIARYSIPTVFSGDFEDIAIGPGPLPEFQYIYLGDIGDNFLSRSNIRVIRFPEPAVYLYQTNSPRVEFVSGAQEILLHYPDGPFDAEALMVDPITGDLFIATKSTTVSRIYRASRANLDGGGLVELTFIREISFSGFRSVSAADISPDGKLIAMRRNARAWWWVRGSGQSVGNALGGTASELTLVSSTISEPNGEALAFHPTGRGFYTLSEGFSQTNYYYRRTDSGVPPQPVVLIGPVAEWRYQDQGTNAGTAWRQPAFNDSAWASGAAQLGYGQGDEQTTVSFGPDEFFKNTTTYFRKKFTLVSGVNLTNVALRICFTDGVAVYLNGIEVFRRNLATNATFDVAAFASNSAKQNYWSSFPVSPTLLHTGTNTMAVELHRMSSDGPDLSFNLQLVEQKLEQTPQFTSAPQLVSGMWRIGLKGPVGSQVTIEASSDLASWSEAGRVVLTGGVGQFQESASMERAQRFYRIQHP